MAKGGEEPERSQSQASSTTLGAAVSPAGYAPSPNTCSQALARANQLRVQTLLRQLLSPTLELGHRLGTLRVLRRTMRELDHQLSWLTQVDFFETLERVLRNDTLDRNTDWRLLHDTSQLLIESLPRASYEPDPQMVGQIFASAVQNLGHPRSEVRRAALLLINLQLNERRQGEGAGDHFQRLLGIFIDHGLANERNKQAQRGAILSLPLLMSEQLAEGRDLLPLVRCLSELLVEAEPQLFYSLYLALQRLNMTLGDARFFAYLRQCSPDALMLYRQAGSRGDSMDQAAGGMSSGAMQLRRSLRGSRPSQADPKTSEEPPPPPPPTTTTTTTAEPNSQQAGDQSKQVTFEADHQRAATFRPPAQPQRAESGASSDASLGVEARGAGSSGIARQATRGQPNTGRPDPEAHLYLDAGESSAAPSEDSASLASEQLSGVGRRPSQALDFLDRSSVSSTCSSEANLVDPSHYMNEAALSGHPLANYDQVHHVDHSSTGLAINDLCVSCSPTMELGPGAQNELKFGIFPRHLVTAALGSRNYLDRLEALQEMMCIVRDSPINHLAILMTYFDSFLGQFLARLMEPGTEYKVELIAIDMIETIVIKTKVSAMQYIRPLVGLLVRSLGDPRAIFRENSVRVIHKMMGFLPPQHVIDALFEHKHSRSALVREESVNRVTAAVLDYDRNEFNLTKLCYHVLPMLADQQAQVRLAALECIATLAHALGPERIGSLLTAAEAVQTGCDYDGFLDAIHARIMRRQLPRCQADGSIRYVIKPFLSPAGSAFHQEQEAPDVRWVLEAPSRHQHQHQHHEAAEAGEIHHAHRPGAYSPVPAGAGGRRCSVPAAVMAEQSADRVHHHHHHHHHNQHSQHSGARKSNGHHHEPTQDSQQRPGPAKGGPTAESRGSVTEPNGDCDAGSVGQQPARRDSCRQAGDTRDGQVVRPAKTTTSNESEIEKRPQQGTKLSGTPQAAERPAANTAQQRGHKPEVGAKTPSGGSGERRRGKRSSSQDSSSSTDTNKVLFQYYLGKFKQSLEDTGNGTLSMQSVLPSDSIIYTDIVQAYELSRHQSRHQQTSFDYDSGPVGRVPVSVDQPGGSQRQSMIGSHETGGGGGDSLSVKDQQQRRISSAESSGSESPQTVMEQAEATSARRRSEAQQARQVRQTSGGEASGGSSRLISGESEERQLRRQAAAERRASRHSSREQTGEDDSEGQAIYAHNQTGEHASSPRKRSSAERKQSRQWSAAENGHQVSEQTPGSRKSSGGQPAANEEEDGSRRIERGSCDRGEEPLSMGGSRDQISERLRSQVSSGGEAEGDNAHTQSGQINAELQQQQQQQQSRPRGLIRQSASAMVANDEPAGGEPTGETDSGRSASPGDQQQLQQPSEPLDGMRLSQPSMTSRQESTGTTDSHSSQRSDHATQTTPQHDRPSRRRRNSRRRSSMRREDSLSRTGVGGDDPDENSTQIERQVEQQARRRASKSQPPRRQLSRASSRSHLHQDTAGGGSDSRRSVSVSPSVATNVNIRHILENVADSEGPFQEPQLALRVAMEALSGPCWSTKVEGILALIRLAAHHQQTLVPRLHEVTSRVASETRNLRSTVARSAIFALGDFCSRLERSIEPEMETIVQALLQKSIENTAFIRDDIRRALTAMVDHLTQWRLANTLINHGAGHKNMHVRRMASQFVALLVERMGPAKCLVGARDISAKLIPAAAKFAQDSSPHTRYYGRLILARIMQHSAFERLLRKTLVPNMYRSTIGIVESIKRRGAGEPPIDA